MDSSVLGDLRQKLTRGSREQRMTSMCSNQLDGHSLIKIEAYLWNQQKHGTCNVLFYCTLTLLPGPLTHYFFPLRAHLTLPSPRMK